MTTLEIIANIRENGGLDMEYIERAAMEDGVSVHNYVKDYVKEAYGCGDYVAQKVAEHYAAGYDEQITELYNRLDNLIPISEYAQIHDKAESTIRQKILRGKLKAVKIGRNWLIDKNTPYVDYRMKTE